MCAYDISHKQIKYIIKLTSCKVELRKFGEVLTGKADDNTEPSFLFNKNRLKV